MEDAGLAGADAAVVLSSSNGSGEAGEEGWPGGPRAQGWVGRGVGVGVVSCPGLGGTGASKQAVLVDFLVRLRSGSFMSFLCHRQLYLESLLRYWP